jgi:hypothetical protein
VSINHIVNIIVTCVYFEIHMLRVVTLQDSSTQWLSTGSVKSYLFLNSHGGVIHIFKRLLLPDAMLPGQQHQGQHVRHPLGTDSSFIPEIALVRCVPATQCKKG